MAMNTGWEVTGPFDVEMQLAGLSLVAQTTGTAGPDAGAGYNAPGRL
jgi:hypothetical protein